MATALIPVKTPDGQAELTNRQRRLSQRHRTVLLLVDGRRTADQVQTLARQAGATDTCFGDLIELGLIVLQPTEPLRQPVPGAHSSLHVDIHLDAIESVLPAARTLQPESVLDDTLNGASQPDVSLPPTFDALEAGADGTLEEARGILIRALRAEAPVAGSLTLLRLRRARTRSELAELIDEVEARILKPYRTLSAQQTLRRVRHLLVSHGDSVLPAA